VYIFVPKEELSPTEGLSRFTLAIRGESDPTDTAQGRRNRGEDWASRGMLTWKDINKRGIVGWKEMIWDCLADGEPRTFNHITVDICDRTADICLQRNPEWALWDLVHAKVVEHTHIAPIRFRRCDHQSEDGPVESLDDPRIQLVGDIVGPGIPAKAKTKKPRRKKTSRRTSL
jgi:hypothetical protein